MKQHEISYPNTAATWNFVPPHFPVKTIEHQTIEVQCANNTNMQSMANLELGIPVLTLHLIKGNCIQVNDQAPIFNSGSMWPRDWGHISQKYVVVKCYSVNHYKPLQNRLLRKPLQTFTNSYIPVTPQTVTNCYKLLQTVTNCYKPLQTIYSINRYEPLHYQSDTTK